MRISRLPILILAALTVSSRAAAAQDPDPGSREAYFRVVSEHFHVPLQEVTIVGEWGLTPDEVPVVLFLADRAGVTPDALIGSRRNGRAWSEVAGRFGVTPQAFHLPLPPDTPLGPLAGAYEQFRRLPAREWTRVQLEDPDIVTLVNLRVLGDQTGAPPGRILRALEEAGSYVGAYGILIRR